MMLLMVQAMVIATVTSPMTVTTMMIMVITGKSASIHVEYIAKVGMCWL